MCVLCVFYWRTVVEPWLLLVCQWVGLTLRLTGFEDWIYPQCPSCCVENDPQRRICLSGILCVLRPPFGCAASGANLVVFWCVWSWLLGVFFLVPVGRRSHTGWFQPCLWLAWDYLADAIKLYAVDRCLCWAWKHVEVDSLWTEVSYQQYSAWFSIVKGSWPS